MPPARTINMSRLGEALTELDDPPVAALVVFDANPAAAAPNQVRVREGLAREDLFTVVLEQRLTDTTDYADVVLPATMQPEHADLHCGLRPSVPRLERTGGRAARRVPAEHRDLPAHRASARARPSAAAGLRPRARAAAARHARLPRGRHHARAAARASAGCALGFERGTAPFADGGFPTPSGKVELWSNALARTGTTRSSATCRRTRRPTRSSPTRYPLVLLAPASRFFVNSTFASIPWHRRQDRPATRAPRIPTTPPPRGIETGEPIRVWNDRGSFLAEAVVDDAARPGVAFTLQDAVAEAHRPAARTSTRPRPSATPTWAAGRPSTTTASRSRPSVRLSAASSRRSPPAGLASI